MDIHELITLLGKDGIAVPASAPAQWSRHASLVQEWNRVASLVSVGDAARLELVHLPDALSVAAVVARLGFGRGRLLDIGTGGGYPGIPVKIALPELNVTLVERSVKKIGFLRKVVAALGLKGVRIIHGDFPECVQGETTDVVTARAVELPEKIRRAVAAWMPEGAVFLCQSGVPVEFGGEMFHVEQCGDAWSVDGGRRGELHIVRRMR